MADGAAQLREILQRIETVRAKSPLAAREVTLVAVSKTHGADAILPLLEAGHRTFGENRVQEAEEKWPSLRARYPDIVLHLIGPLQTNKAKEALQLFDVIETVDRAGLADAIIHETRKLGAIRTREFFVQVNTGEEAQKAGAAPDHLPSLLEHCNSHGLPIHGLMCIPPASDAPAPHFALLHKLAKDAGLTKLSMGMSADFETAIRMGATHVRVGTALFGERQ